MMPTMMGAMIAGEKTSALEVSANFSLLLSRSASRNESTSSSTEANTKIIAVFCSDFQNN